MDPLLSVRLSVSYPQKPGVLRGVAFDVAPAEIVGLVGQSGSGKSTLALALLGLLDRRNAKVSGYAHFQGRDLAVLNDRQMRPIRGKDIALVLQSASSSLNPYLRIATQCKHAWKAHAKGAWSTQKRSILNMFADLDLPSDEAFLRRYPGEISIGQAQRVLVAMSVMHRPALLVVDEPTSALDVMARADLLDLFRKLNWDLGMAILYISHDLATVASLCHRVCILHEGQITESASAPGGFAPAESDIAAQLISALEQAREVPTRA